MQQTCGIIYYDINNNNKISLCLSFYLCFQLSDVNQL